MFKNSIDTKKRHERFIKEVILSGQVWTLNNKHGYVSSESIHFEDENEEPLIVQVFWSTEKEARVCSRNAWKKENFELDSIPVAEFIEAWCLGMHNDFVVVGTNFHHQLFGHEEEPLVVAKQLLEEAQSTSVNLSFENFDHNKQLLEVIEKHLNDV